jgi:transposase
MTLTDEQRGDLESLAGRRYDRSPAARARMVLLRDDGKSVPEIAREVETSPTTVRTWLERYEKEGMAGLETRKPPGRPWQVSGRERARILALSKQTPPEETGLSHWTTYELASHLRRHEGIFVSHNFIAELWRENGIKPHRRRNFKLSTDPFLREQDPRRGRPLP